MQAHARVREENKLEEKTTPIETILRLEVRVLQSGSQTAFFHFSVFSVYFPSPQIKRKKAVWERDYEFEGSYRKSGEEYQDDILKDDSLQHKGINNMLI